jgi:N-acetylneuraminate lyase
MMKFPPMTGLTAAPFTPMLPDGSLDLRAIEPLAAALASAGVSGVFVCGTTGEWPSLTVDERMQVAQRWKQAAPDSLRVVIHVGALCQADARALAAHAARIGAHAIGALAPCFFRPRGAAELVDFLAPVAAAAPGLPFYYYHIPSLTGVNVSVSELLAAASGRIPTLAGAKFTFENLHDFHRAMRMDDGRYDLLFGRDEILLSALVLGCRGAVGSTYTFAAPLYRKLWSAFDAGDIAQARRLQAAAADIITVMIAHGGLAAGKAMMKLIGLNCGPARAPLFTPGAQQVEALRADLERAGFFEFAVRA